MLAQVRSGGIEFFTPSALVIATLVPVAAINAVGFAFSDYSQVWGAMDGKLGAHVRGAIAKSRLYAFEKMWDNGFRQTTSSKAAVASAKDMDGLKIRVPVSPLSISMFKGLGAAPASLQFSEVYSALQTKIVDAQENPLPIIQVAKLFEVQKFCSLTNHIWDGYWFIANGRAWDALPDDLKTIVARAINDAGLQQREDIKKLNESVVGDLQAKGLAINRPTADSFRAKLRESGFYGEWKGRFGPEAWGCSKAPSASWPERPWCMNPLSRRRPQRSASRRSLRIGQPAERHRLARRPRARRQPSRPWPRCWCWPRSACCSPAWCRAMCSMRRWSGRTSWRPSSSCGCRCWAPWWRCAAASTCA
jgi:tripartite ATP-independent transporter DctP family solute receptor